MSEIEKRLIKTAIKKAATWGTEIDVNAAGTLIAPFNAGAIKMSSTFAEEENVQSAFQDDLDLLQVGPVDFPLDFHWRYEGLENLLLALLFGTAGIPTQQGTTTAYLHTFQLANKIPGFYTYATEKLDKFHVIRSAKPYKASFTFDGGRVKLSISNKGDKLIDDSATITSLANATIADKFNRVLSKQGLFRMNTQTGAALASPTDDIKVKNFTLDIERVLEGGSFTADSLTCLELLETAKLSLKLTLEFVRMDATNELYFANWLAEAEKKADITFTGALIETPYYYKALFQFPRLKVEDVEYSDEGIIPAKITLRGLEASSAPTGMTGITKPVQLELINKRITDYLS